ncbi:MAG: hypothetical protein RIQ81_639 [Pseudomonadota bacterium]|jgi:hypothetical protein
MKSWKNLASLAFSLFVAVSGLPPALAADPPLKVSASYDLSDSQGEMTFFELMASPKSGIKAALDRDHGEPVRVVSAVTFRKRAGNFAHLRKLESRFVDGADGLDALVGSLAGQTIPVSSMYGRVIGALKSQKLAKTNDPQQLSRLAGALVPVIAIASGKGVLVRLDDENYCYNYGYAPGSGGADLEADKTSRKTGRSYGASIERNAYDPSDNDYLRGLAVYAYEASDRELAKFYSVLFQILLKSDASGLKDLSPAGQTVMSDFMAIYMAELDRHLMTGLKMYEWENALTEITMLAAYSAQDQGLTLDPRSGSDNQTNSRELVSSGELPPRDRLTGFFGVGTQGSGLDGRNKARRHALTKKVVAAMREQSPELVTRIEDLMKLEARVDLYDFVMNRINNFKTQDLVRENADELIDALVKFVMATRGGLQLQ